MLLKLLLKMVMMSLIFTIFCVIKFIVEPKMAFIWDMTGHRRITNLVLTHIAQTWGIKLPKHIKMNIDIDTCEIDLNSEKLADLCHSL